MVSWNDEHIVKNTSYCHQAVSSGSRKTGDAVAQQPWRTVLHLTYACPDKYVKKTEKYFSNLDMPGDGFTYNGTIQNHPKMEESCRYLLILLYWSCVTPA